MNPKRRFRPTERDQPTETGSTPKHEASEADPDQDVRRTENASQSSEQKRATKPSNDMSAVQLSYPCRLLTSQALRFLQFHRRLCEDHTCPPALHPTCPESNAMASS